VQAADAILATLIVIDLVAVTDVETFVCAEAPEGVLNKAGKDGWELRIVAASVDVACRELNDVSAAAWPVAAKPVGVLRGKAL
jgi:hypothetical protein